MSSFSSRLIESFTKDKTQFLISPYSLSSALRLAYLGASGETKKQLAPAASDGAALHGAVLPYLREFNAVLIPEGVPVAKSYKKAVQTDTSSKAHIVPIGIKPEDAAAKVNALAAEHTEGEITKVVTAEDFPRSTQAQSGDGRIHTTLTLLNILHFKANWDVPFDASRTIPRVDFTPFGGQASSPSARQPPRHLVTMMHKTSKHLLYAETKTAQYLQLAYVDPTTDVEFDCVLLLELPKAMKSTEGSSESSPSFPTGFSDFFSQDNSSATTTGEGGKNVGDTNQPGSSMKTFINTAFSCPKGGVDLSLPKFRVESSMKLKKMLQCDGLSIKLPFTEGKADFNSVMDDKRKDEWEASSLGEVIQKVIFEVDETGTKAAAVTVISMPMSGSAGPPRTPPPPPIPFHCNRTFSYALIHQPTGTPLFVGVFDGKK